jgi:hypothetical protein
VEAIRVGDKWPIPVPLARNLLGDTPDPKEDYKLDGTLIEVHKGASALGLTAVIDITGEFTVSDRLSRVKARIDFDFDPTAVGPARVATGTSPKSAGASGKSAETIIKAKGWVSHLALGQTFLNFIPDTDDRLKVTADYKLNVWRRRLPSAPNAAGGAQGVPLSVPDPAPTANEDNSWLTYDDPMGRFRFRHPQDLRLEPGMVDPNIVGLIDRQFHKNCALSIWLLPKEANTERDPEFHRRSLYSMWEKQNKEVVGDSVGWLPEADWKPRKRKVHRIEAAVREMGAAANAPRIYWDNYLVLFDTNQTVVVTARTDEDHLQFRDQSEAVIKSLELAPSEGQPKGPAATQAPAPKPPL